MNVLPTYWRLAAEFAPSPPEDSRSRSIEGWYPSRTAATERTIARRVVISCTHDDLRQRCFRYDLTVVEVQSEGEAFVYAIDYPGVTRYYLPATASTPAAFRVVSDLEGEGHWRRTREEDDDLLWPEPDPSWSGRRSFLKELDRAEWGAERIHYRGPSHCRLCGRENGSRAMRLGHWEWPEGYRHYLVDHDVRAADDFQAFVAEQHISDDPFDGDRLVYRFHDTCDFTARYEGRSADYASSTIERRDGRLVRVVRPLTIP